MAIKESGEMYLEAIYVLSQKSDEVRAIDVGDYLGYSKPSVSRALGLLTDDGYISRNEDSFISLTETGKKHAKSIYERHTLLTELFTKLGVDIETATEDACRIEHYISDTTFNAIKEHMLKCSRSEDNPE